MERFDTVIVGGGTAGCVLAARLSEDPDRSVCLVEAGPDYGALADGRWPADMLDPRRLALSHDWGRGGEDKRSLGARIIGGCSAHNACAVFQGQPEDYDEWGPEWSYVRFEPYLRRARRELRTTSANTDTPAPFHTAFAEAAQAVGLPRLDDADDPAQPVGFAPFPANVSGGVRWHTGLAYLDAARDRPNLTIRAQTLVDRLLLSDGGATGVVVADGERIEAGTVVLAAGAYFSPSILLRSGIGPEEELRRHAIPVAAALPVGEQLLDHCGSGIAWEPSDELHASLAEHEADHELYEPHLALKAASSFCPPRSLDLHVLPWANRAEAPGRYEVSAGFFLMKPRSQGRLRLRSDDPRDLPLVERGFFRDPSDLPPLVEALGLVRRIADAEPLRSLLAAELRPADADVETYLRETVRNYFHPAGTCAIGSVVDERGRVLGFENLVVADASIMPTIPRANTNLTVVAIAERLAELLRED